jgi:hypothetical protein
MVTRARFAVCDLRNRARSANEIGVLIRCGNRGSRTNLSASYVQEQARLLPAKQPCFERLIRVSFDRLTFSRYDLRYS